MYPLEGPRPGGSPTDRPRPGRVGASDAAIWARNLSKRFDDVDVVRGLDLAVEPGTILGLIGPSGCGKTTTVRLLTGLLAPSAGEARIHGHPATRLGRSERERIGYLPQTPALFPDLSLAENLSFHASMYGLPLRRGRRIDELLEWVELAEHRGKLVADASGGMRRRLALAAAFVQSPDTVFLDEPTAGIDPILRDKFWTRFRQAAGGGTTLLVTTQYVGEAGKCDVVGLLSDGELLLLDTPEGLRRAAFGGEVIDVMLAAPVAADALQQLRAHRAVLGVEHADPLTLRVVVDDAGESIGDVTAACHDAGLDVVNADEHAVDFEEAFVRIVERHRGTHLSSTVAGDAPTPSLEAPRA
jgi:ABC-2 type transport system ATP-binding protein